MSWLTCWKTMKMCATNTKQGEVSDVMSTDRNMEHHQAQHLPSWAHERAAESSNNVCTLWNSFPLTESHAKDIVPSLTNSTRYMRAYKSSKDIWGQLKCNAVTWCNGTHTSFTCARLSSASAAGRGPEVQSKHQELKTETANRHTALSGRRALHNGLHM